MNGSEEVRPPLGVQDKSIDYDSQVWFLFVYQTAGILLLKKELLFF